MNKVRLPFKAGNTLVLNCVYSINGVGQSLDGVQISSKVFKITRSIDGVAVKTLVATLTVSIVDSTQGRYKLTATPAETTTWPEGELAIDIKYVLSDGTTVATPTFEIDCELELS